MGNNLIFIDTFQIFVSGSFLILILRRIKSVIDGVPMDGVASLRIHSGPDIRTDKHILRFAYVVTFSLVVLVH